jgi:hypothetical protein
MPQDPVVAARPKAASRPVDQFLGASVLKGGLWPLGYFLAINAASWVVLHLLGVPRLYLLNADYVVPIAAYVLLRNRFPVAATLLFLLLLLWALIFDILGRIGNLFFINASFLGEYVRFVDHWPWPIILIGAAVLTGSLAVAFVIIRRMPPIRSMWAALASLVAILLADGALSRANAAGLGVPNLLSSATRSALEPIVQVVRSETFRLEPAPASWAADSRLTATAPTRTLSVAVESLGAPIDPVERQRLLEPLIAGLGARYRLVVNRDHPFHGGTLSGEFRELCGVVTRGIPHDDVQVDPGLDCLPRRTRKAAGNTIALHGNSASFYQRRSVYPAMGFEHSLFSDDPVFRNAERCGELVFGGICDRAVYAEALSRFRKDKAGFGHVMTLDTHFPLLQPASCRASVPTGDVPCSYHTAIRATLQQLASAVGVSHVRPDRIVVYGDHAPPFLNSSARGAFRADHVPFLVFDRIENASG